MTEPSPLADSFGRTIDYLRISVTDRCNFRCVYCVPPEGIPPLCREEVLTFEEITRIARIFLELGGKKLRLTGGEALVRKDIPKLVSGLSSLDGLQMLGLTTNGFHLEDLAKPLKKEGLTTINVSLDSVLPGRFASLTGVNAFEKVWKGIEAALLCGLRTKINVVVLKGLKEEEIIAMGEMARNLPLEIRFIEFMPLCGSGWYPEWMLPIREVREKLQRRFDLIPMVRGEEVAESYKIKGGKGSLGFIASMTEPFCRRCSRMRLTADGKLRPCLFSNLELDLRKKLREGWADREIADILITAVRQKPGGHGVLWPVQDASQFPRIRFLGG